MIPVTMRLLLNERTISTKLIFFVTLLFVLITPGSTKAHSVIKRSKPSEGEILDGSPEVVQIWFELDLDTFESSIAVLDSNGKRVDLADSRVNTADRTEMTVSLFSNLPPGDYTVKWIAVDDADAHQVAGEYIFSIAGTPISTEQAGIPLWLISLLILVGGGIITLIVRGFRKRYT